LLALIADVDSWCNAGADLAQAAVVRNPSQRRLASDALSIARSETDRVDMAQTASLLGTDEADAAGQLQTGVKVFCDPQTQSWQPANVYLSGLGDTLLRPR
jgi:N12 class adenine-specific DNA methylase